MTCSRLALHSLSRLGLALSVAVSTGAAQDSVQPAGSAVAASTAARPDSALAAAQFRLADRTALTANTAGLPPFAPQGGGSRTRSTLIGAGVGAVIGGGVGYFLFKGDSEEDCDICDAIGEGTAIEGAIIVGAIGAVIGGIIGYIRGRP